MGVFLLILLVFAGSLHGVFLGFYNKNYPGDKKDASHVYSAMLGLIVAFISFAAAGFSFSFSWLSLAMGVVNGIAVILYNYFLAKGTELGSYAILMISALSSGILLPLAANAILGDTFAPLTLIGIAVMLVAFILLSFDFKALLKKARENNSSESYASEKPNQKAKMAYIVCVILIFISNGTYGILNSFEERFEASAHTDEFIVFTYLTTTVLSLAMLMLNKRKLTVAPMKQTKKSALFLVLGALCITALINLLMIVFKTIPSEVVYTVNNGGTLVLSAFLSLFIFRERISVQKWIGIAVAAVSMVLLAL